MNVWFHVNDTWIYLEKTIRKRSGTNIWKVRNYSDNYVLGKIKYGCIIVSVQQTSDSNTLLNYINSFRRKGPKLIIVRISIEGWKLHFSKLLIWNLVAGQVKCLLRNTSDVYLDDNVSINEFEKNKHGWGVRFRQISL